MWAVFLAGLVAFEVIADIFVKEHSLKRTWWTFAVGLMGYVLANVCWLISMRYKSQLALGANIFSASSGVVAAIIGCLIYKEVLTPCTWWGSASDWSPWSS
jgi:multidrug transporter EmrE-like cation transporter